MDILAITSYYNIGKLVNKRAIMDVIRFTAGGISRADLARQMGLTRSAISIIIDDLKKLGLVNETNTYETARGRRPVLLAVNPTAGYVVGVDMGATHVRLAVSDYASHILEEIEYPFCVENGPENCLSQINDYLFELLKCVNLSINQVSAIGLGVPGPIVDETGQVSSPPIMPGWDGYPIRSHLEEMWGKPVVIGNDAEFGALGEWAYGAGRGERNLAYIKVGTGVGAGLLLDGRIYRGSTGSAGEIGHVTIVEDGPLCSCGNYGCLEELAGGRAIARNAKDAIESGRRTQLSAMIPETINASDVATVAQHGDLVAQQIITDAGVYLGIAIASLVNFINPSLVIIGGGVSQVGDLLLEPIRKTVMQRSIHSAAKILRITSTVLGRRATCLGAVVQAVNISLDRIVEV